MLSSLAGAVSGCSGETLNLAGESSRPSSSPALCLTRGCSLSSAPDPGRGRFPGTAAAERRPGCRRPWGARCLQHGKLPQGQSWPRVGSATLSVTLLSALTSCGVPVLTQGPGTCAHPLPASAPSLQGHGPPSRSWGVASARPRPAPGSWAELGQAGAEDQEDWRAAGPSWFHRPLCAPVPTPCLLWGLQLLSNVHLSSQSCLSRGFACPFVLVGPSVSRFTCSVLMDMSEAPSGPSGSLPF